MYRADGFSAGGVAGDGMSRFRHHIS